MGQPAAGLFLQPRGAQRVRQRDGDRAPQLLQTRVGDTGEGAHLAMGKDQHRFARPIGSRGHRDTEKGAHVIAGEEISHSHRCVLQIRNM